MHKHATIAALIVVASSTVNVMPARAEVILAGGNASMCLDLNQSTGKVTLFPCHGGPNQNFFNTGVYGPQRFSNKCLQGTGEGADLFMGTCNSGRDQKWLLDTNGRYRNEGGWCAEVRGTRVVSTNCGNLRAPRGSTVFARGQFLKAGATGVMANAKPGAVFYGGRQVALAAASPAVNGLVASGGGNLVATGGGNLVASGGGNAISINGGALVASGGGN